MTTVSASEIEPQLDLHSHIDNSSITGLQVAIIFMCFLLNMLDGFDVLAMAYTAPSIGEEWGLAAHKLGAVFSAGIIGMTIGAMFLSPFADVHGRRPLIVVSVFTIGICHIATGLAESLWVLVALRFIAGLGIGILLACLTTTVAEFTPDRHRNLAVGLLQSGYPIGATLGGVLAALVIPEFGWRAVFFGGGTFALIMTVVVFFLLPESMQFLLQRRPRNALHKINRILSRLGESPITALPPTPDHSGQAPARASVTTLLLPEHRGRTIRLWTAFFLSFVTLYFLQSWVPKLLVDAGLPLAKAIYAGASINLGGALGMIVLGALSNRWGLPRTISVYLVLGAVFMVLFTLVPNEIALLLSLSFVIGFLVIGGFVGLYAVAARIYPATVRTTGVGWAIGAGRVGAVIGSYSGGVLISMNFSMGSNFLIFAIPLLLSGVVAATISSPALGNTIKASLKSRPTSA